MNVYAVKTTARIQLGDGRWTSAEIWFHVEGTPDTVKDKVFRMEKNAVLGFGRDEVTPIGEVLMVGSNDATSFMGVRFGKDTIRKVYKFDTDNVEIVTDKDTFNISYGHLPKTERGKVLSKFLSALATE